jgi:protein subunit release factor A
MSTSTPASNETVIVEIRAAEGGADAKLLVPEQLGIYARLAERRRL